MDAGSDRKILIIEDESDVADLLEMSLRKAGFKTTAAADGATGLLLKARVLNERGEPIEQFAFSDLTINARIDRAMVEPDAVVRDQLAQRRELVHLHRRNGDDEIALRAAGDAEIAA